jgi:hypothetical protein
MRYKMSSAFIIMGTRVGYYSLTCFRKM